MAKYNLDEVKSRQLDTYIDSLEQKEGALIGILYKAQEIFGYLPEDVQLFIARKLGITDAKVFGVTTFYSYFTMEHRGKHVINVCKGTACFVKGAVKILEEIKKSLVLKRVICLRMVCSR